MIRLLILALCVALVPARPASSQVEWVVGPELTVLPVADDLLDSCTLTDLIGAGWSSEGGVWVADARSGAVHRYAPGGPRVDAVPAVMAGAGRALPYRADSVAVWDLRARRISVVSAHDGTGREVPVSFPMVQDTEIRVGTAWAQPQLLGTLEDGSFVLAPPTLAPSSPGVLTSTERELWLYGADGSPVRSLGGFPGPGSWLPPVDQLARLGPGARLPSPPYPPVFSVATSATRVAVGASAGYEIEVFSAAGEHLLTIVRNDVDVELTPAHVDAYLRQERSAVPDGDALWEEMLESLPYPPTVPPFRSVRADEDGHLWVEGFPDPSSPGPTRWDVFDDGGERVALVRTPEGFEPLAIGRDALLGVQRSEDGSGCALGLLRLHR